MNTKKKVPLRKCVGCGEMKPKKEMVRVIKDSENNISVDLTGKKNGRGAYICKSIDCFHQAEKNKGIERSLKMEISKEVYEAIGKELNCLDGE